jgi:hypothetical protein
MPELFDWSMPPLDPTQERLVDAYLTIGRPFDDLPYTEDFEQICALIGAADSDEARHFVYRQLLRLKKTGRLPSFGLLKE